MQTQPFIMLGVVLIASFTPNLITMIILNKYFIFFLEPFEDLLDSVSDGIHRVEFTLVLSN